MRSSHSIMAVSAFAAIVLASIAADHVVLSYPRYSEYPEEGAAFGRWDAAAGPDRWTEAAALRNLISHIRPGSNMVMGSKRSSFPARIFKKYNKARAIMGKRSDTSKEDEMIGMA